MQLIASQFRLCFESLEFLQSFSKALCMAEISKSLICTEPPQTHAHEKEGGGQMQKLKRVVENKNGILNVWCI